MDKYEPIPWRGVNVLEKLVILVLLFSAVVVLALGFLSETLIQRLLQPLGIDSNPGWLVVGPKAFFIFAGILVLLIVLAALIRFRLIRDKRTWFGTGCPDCKERDLVRVKRHFSDRFYGLIRLPAYRYACRNCTWRGIRIARRDRSPKRDLERELALRRFQPDGLPLREEFERDALEYAVQLEETSPFDFGDETSESVDEFAPSAHDLNETAESSGHRFTILGFLDKPHPARRHRTPPS